MGSVVVGQNVPRLDGPGKATGRTVYAGDLHLPGMLYAKIPRSPVPHAVIKSMDISVAQRLPGVKQVVTANDAPRGPQGSFVKDEALFARDRVRQVGERVAAVAAVSPEIAEEALDLIRVEYEELSPLVDPEAAMAEGAPLVHETANEYIADRPSIRSGNVCTYV